MLFHWSFFGAGLWPGRMRAGDETIDAVSGGAALLLLFVTASISLWSRRLALLGFLACLFKLAWLAVPWY